MESHPSNLVWRKSSRSMMPDGGCVEIADGDDAVYVRDSKDRAGPVLAFDRQPWLDFIAAVRSGEFDRHDCP